MPSQGVFIFIPNSILFAVVFENISINDRSEYIKLIQGLNENNTREIYNWKGESRWTLNEDMQRVIGIILLSMELLRNLFTVIVVGHNL